MPSKSHKLAFSTFLKLLELPEEKKRPMLKGFTREGGYNYWRPIQMLSDDVAHGILAEEQISDRVRMMCKEHQQKYNALALTRLSKWLKSRKIKVLPTVGKIERKFTNSGLMVRMEPEVAFEMSGIKYLMQIWATNTPSLSERTISAGLHFLQFHMRKAEFSEYQFLIFDATKEIMHNEINILQSASDVLKGERLLIQELWNEVWGDKNKSDPDSKWAPSDHPGLH